MRIASRNQREGAKNRRTAARSREKKRHELLDKQTENDRLSKLKNELAAELEAADEILRLLRTEFAPDHADHDNIYKPVYHVAIDEPLEDMQSAFQVEPAAEHSLVQIDQQ
jgi:hypothetical protein